MKKLTFLFTLLLLPLVVSADGTYYSNINIDGIFYNLNSYPMPVYDSNGMYLKDSLVNSASVTYDKEIDLYTNNKETYQGDLVIPETVQYAGIDYKVTDVDYYAFMYNNLLTSISFPKTTNSVGETGRLRELNNLTSITVAEGNANYTTIDGVLYNKDVTKILCFPKKKGGTYRIPATVTVLDEEIGSPVLDELVIPATVTKIANAFGYNTRVKKVTIEDGEDELTIGRGSNSCSYTDENGIYQTLYPLFCNWQLEEVYWGRPLKYQSKYLTPFAQSNVQKIIFGPKVTKIPDYTFIECWSINTIDILGGIEQWCGFDFTGKNTSPFPYSAPGPYPGSYPGSYGTVLFNGGGLKGAVVIPEGVTTIPSHAFQYSCSEVTSLSIPASVTSIADGAFRGLSSLNKIDLAEGNVNFCIEDNVLYNKDKTKMLCFPQLRAGDFTMPSTITEMANMQFYNCVNLTGVTLSDKIKTITESAFSGCTGLIKIDIPVGVDSIAHDAFYNCTSLDSIAIPAGVKALGSNTFYNCASLDSVFIPASVKRVDYRAFADCSALKQLVFEDAADSLILDRGSIHYKDTWNNYEYDNETGAFGASNLDSLYIGRNLSLSYGTSYKTFGSIARLGIGNQVKKVPASLFRECYSIKSVWFNGTIQEWCGISFGNEQATPFGPSNSAILYLDGKALHSQVNIPEGATKIGAYSFYGQNGVSTFIVPSTVKSIEKYAFNASYVSDVTINATDIVTLVDTLAFNSDAMIFVKDAVVQAYRKASVWNKIAGRICPQGFKLVSVDLVAMETSPALLPALNALEKVNGDYRITALTNLKIRGTMNGWDILMIRNKMPNLRYLDLEEATILDNDGGMEYYQGYHTTANTISPYSFYQLKNLKSIILPSTITTIAHNAFEESGVQSVTILGESVTSIGSSAFRNSQLKNIVIPGSVKRIQSSAFESCYRLTDLSLNKGLVVIESNAFNGCNNLRRLVLPTTLKVIGSNAFSNCNNLLTIDFAEGLEYIRSGAFQYCYQLKNLHMPTSLEVIENDAFRYCSGLTEVHVPSMITQIGDYAFKGCGLRSVYAYTVVPVSINQNTFDYDGVDLYAPKNSFYKYYLNTQWSQFLDVKEFEALYTNWYTPRNTDYEVDVKKPIMNLYDNNPADGDMQPGSGLIFIGDGEQLVKNLIMNWEHGSDYPALIENGNLNVEELKFLMNVYPGRWYFFSFPFDVNIKDITFDVHQNENMYGDGYAYEYTDWYVDKTENTTKGKWVWRYYDGAERAKNGHGGWKDVEGNVLKANQGYIFQCNTSGDLNLPVCAPKFPKEQADKEVALQSIESKNAQDASWNFVGNPNLSYYGLDDMAEKFDAPITVWNADQQTYTAVVPGDDDYDFHPFEAYFVQTPENKDNITFENDKRATNSQTKAKAAKRAARRAARRVNENRMLVNLTVSNGQTTDKTRVIFNDENKLTYETGRDANKFMSMANVPQIYTLDGANIKYSVNARPNGNREVRIGFVASADGEYTINAERMDCRMALKDHETGTIHPLDDGAYKFYSEAGTFDNRFTLISGNDATAISAKSIDGISMETIDGGIVVAGANDGDLNIYKLNGVKAGTILGSGTVRLDAGAYIVTYAGKSAKIVVK